MQEKTKDFSIFLSRLSSLMSAKCLSQSELARITGIRQATISDYTKGNSIPSAERFFLLANALDVSMDYLWGTSDNMTRDDNNSKISESEWEKRALTAEKKLSSLREILPLLGEVNARLTKLIAE